MALFRTELSGHEKHKIDERAHTLYTIKHSIAVYVFSLQAPEETEFCCLSKILSNKNCAAHKWCHFHHLIVKATEESVIPR